MKKLLFLLLWTIMITGLSFSQIKRGDKTKGVTPVTPSNTVKENTAPKNEPAPISTMAKTVMEPGVDIDQDNLSDKTEHDLLQRFSPYLLFSNDNGDEFYNPTSVYDYIRQSRLLNSTEENDRNAVIMQNNQLFYYPESILFTEPAGTASSLLVNKQVTRRFIDPTDQARKGKSWGECLNERNVGLYGHVVPYKQSAPQTDFVNFQVDPAKTYYKIEYWQFFGYNGLQNSLIDKFASHEGDWTTVQLLYCRETDAVVKAFFYSHGLEFVYDMSLTQHIANIEDNSMKEYRGPNFRYNPDIEFVGINFKPTGDFWKTQNNVVRFYKDPDTGLYEHPVVYIEKGSHEFYPSPYWKYYGAPNHNGNSHRYLSRNIPNLGEVEQPLSECLEAKLILQFNGYWGAQSAHNNEPGPGPSLHRQWLWPPSSSIRWLLKDLPF